MVRSEIAPSLKALGFKRTRATFHRSVDENWEVINLQRSQFSDRVHASFTVNLGVGVELLRVDDEAWPAGRRPVEYKCQFRSRIGELVDPPPARDLWWDLDPETDAEFLGRQVVETIKKFALGWLSIYSHPKTAWSRYRADPSAIPAQELYPLGRLVTKLGLFDAGQVLAAESSRRSDELARRRAE
jgi:Domain of unknown function (DUF4304)